MWRRFNVEETLNKQIALMERLSEQFQREGAEENVQELCIIASSLARLLMVRQWKESGELIAGAMDSASSKFIEGASTIIDNM